MLMTFQMRRLIRSLDYYNISQDEFFASHTEEQQLAWLRIHEVVHITKPGKYSSYSDDMQPSEDIVEYCKWNGISAREFNQPVTFAEDMTDISVALAYCTTFNKPVKLPSRATNCEYLFYKNLHFNQKIEFPSTVVKYKGALFMCNDLTEDVIIHSNIETPGEMFRHAYRNFISDNRNEEEAIYQSQPVSVPGYINLIKQE